MRAASVLFPVLAAVALACSSGSPPPREAGTGLAEVRDASVIASGEADASATPDEPPLLVLEKGSFADLDGWAGDDHLAALGALRRSCAALVRKKATAQVGLNHIAGTVADWKPLCAASKSVVSSKSNAAARAFFEEHFVPHRASDRGERVGRFTGYYNARIRASRKKRGKYKTPVWGRPTDLISADVSLWSSRFRGERIWGKVDGTRMVPYDTRAQIGAGSIRARAKVLFWADDPIDVFFAQVQGSAIVELDDGGQSRIGVGGKNGQIYTAIGRVLIADGELTSATVSMQSIRAWMLAHPRKAKGLMEKNEAFVFFREVKGDGPYGAEGVVLTPGRSLAVDLRWLPMPVPLWVETEVPVVGAVGAEEGEPWKRLMIAQDTGGAIRGPVRGDIYFGDDADAFDQAGRMKGLGTYYVLLPTTVVAASAE